MVTLTGALWRLSPAQTPTLERRCSRCAGPVAFEPTGKFRLNANKRRLDAGSLGVAGGKAALRRPVRDGERIELSSRRTDRDRSR